MSAGAIIVAINTNQSDCKWKIWSWPCNLSRRASQKRDTPVRALEINFHRPNFPFALKMSRSERYFSQPLTQTAFLYLSECRANCLSSICASWRRCVGDERQWRVPSAKQKGLRQLISGMTARDPFPACQMHSLWPVNTRHNLPDTYLMRELEVQGACHSWCRHAFWSGFFQKRGAVPRKVFKHTHFNKSVYIFLI